ncbi:MAG: hypothetical protein ACOX9R_20010 [Armatimonadota bacterium]|jgi:hypothetical protein
MQQRTDDPLCEPEITIEARQLLGLVCRRGGAECPLIDADRAEALLARLARDPAVAIRLTSDAECLPHYTRAEGRADPEDALNRMRDLKVLQRLGLCPGDTRRSRYLVELLFERIETPRGICAFDTEGWEGCELAASGAYESVREAGWREVVYCRSDEERATFREPNERAIAEGEGLFIRPHHLMCMSCWYNGGAGSGKRPNDTLAEVLERIQREPDVPITLVEGPCEACDCCDGFHPDSGRCVHAGGLIRDYLKDLDVLQRIGMMPGQTRPAREILGRIYERIASTTEICGFSDGVVTSNEWRVCGGPEGNAGYERTRESGVF